jgi:hypothetical protein
MNSVPLRARVNIAVDLMLDHRQAWCDRKDCRTNFLRDSPSTLREEERIWLQKEREKISSEEDNEEEHQKSHRAGNIVPPPASK